MKSTTMVPQSSMGSGTCWIVKRQDKHSTDERISTCCNKNNCHFSTPFKFCRYTLIPGQLVLVSNSNVTRLAKSEKRNSKSDKRSKPCMKRWVLSSTWASQKKQWHGASLDRFRATNPKNKPPINTPKLQNCWGRASTTSPTSLTPDEISD